MRKLLPLLVAVLLVPGCSCARTQANELPNAYIDLVSPSEVPVGDTVRFDGHGTDVDGAVDSYSWRSDIDGEMSSEAAFESDELSIGAHTIYFKVKDDAGAWSEEVIESIVVLEGASVAESPVVESFKSSPPTIDVGQTTVLSWEVADSSSVTIDQGIGTVQPMGSMPVSPATTTTYVLTASGLGGQSTARVTIIVNAEGEDPGEGGQQPDDEESDIEIPVFEFYPGSIPAGGTATLYWETEGAMDVRIVPNIGDVTTAGSVEVAAPGVGVFEYTLIASNGDDTVTADAELESYLILFLPQFGSMTCEPDIIDSGCICDSGMPDNWLMVGDNGHEAAQMLLTFDISDVPDDANVTGVELDLSQYQTHHGNPFASFGSLRAYVDDYGEFGFVEFGGQLSGAVTRWSSLAELDEPKASDGLKTAVLDRLDDDSIQFRLQFNLWSEDGDGEADNIEWDFNGSYLPQLKVYYQE